MKWLGPHTVIIALVVLFALAAYASMFFVNNSRKPVYGVSFDPEYARYLMPDAGQGFLAVINDWNFKHVRLPIHWDVVEKNRGEFDFSDIDWYVDRAGDKGVKLILSIGQKTPRWPECHLPAWALELPHDEYRAALKTYMEQAVLHYKDHPGLEIWQVENEAFLDFGKCPPITTADLEEEIALVKSLDQNHKVITSDSGELSMWRSTANATDLFGTTMYRKVWNKYFGEWSYRFLPASSYRLKLWLMGRNPETAYVLELQAEPWMPKHINETSPEELLVFMNKADIEEYMRYAEKVGLPRVYLWGAEWWYWLKLKGYNEIPDFIADLPKTP